MGALSKRAAPNNSVKEPAHGTFRSAPPEQFGALQSRFHEWSEWGVEKPTDPLGYCSLFTLTMTTRRAILILNTGVWVTASLSESYKTYFSEFRFTRKGCGFETDRRLWCYHCVQKTRNRPSELGTMCWVSHLKLYIYNLFWPDTSFTVVQEHPASNNLHSHELHIG